MDLLLRPEAASARLELETCEKLGVSPSQFRGRATLTSFLYDSSGRLLRTAQSSPWTEEDRALMLALQHYRAALCPGCGHPTATAWHQHSEDSFELTGEFVCWACTAMQPVDEDGKRELQTYPVVEDTRDYDRFPLKGDPEPMIL